MLYLIIEPEVSPLPRVLGYDHVVAQQQDPPEVHRAPGNSEEKVFASVSAEKRNLESWEKAVFIFLQKFPDLKNLKANVRAMNENEIAAAPFIASVFDQV